MSYNLLMQYIRETIQGKETLIYYWNQVRFKSTSSRFYLQSIRIRRKQIWNQGIPYGYVGLFNLGATCQINSLLQQLFIDFQFRKRILDYQIWIPKDTIYYEIEFQLQLVFIQIQEDVNYYRNLSQLLRHLKDLMDSRLILNSYIQEDCYEFCNLFTRKLKSNMKHTTTQFNGAWQMKSIIRLLFSERDRRTISNIIIRSIRFILIQMFWMGKINIFEMKDYVKLTLEKRCQTLFVQQSFFFHFYLIILLTITSIFIFHLQLFEFDIIRNSHDKIM
ncbi:unnamed protein product [Paramecium sonneborni]|uniref:USP domain-containing protein n=1 Tax=Paramecium sonneborni TaxID=65129 RepID=A0A8S1RSX9_9CILI|nr:unnamed protein product [Paramecium sonneborni]